MEEEQKLYPSCWCGKCGRETLMMTYGGENNGHLICETCNAQYVSQYDLSLIHNAHLAAIVRKYLGGA